MLLSGCATKVVREHYANPAYIVYNEPIIQKVKETSSIPLWVVVIITFVISFPLFTMINAFAGKRKP